MRRKDELSTSSSIAFLLALLLLIIPPLNIPIVAAEAQASIDLYTQKTPFDGRGANRSSDMFGPQEQVVLYASVLTDGMPLYSTLVTYEINGPAAGLQGLKFYQTGRTNSSGIAQTVFSLATINETDAFGSWAVIATVQIAGRMYCDTVTFQVDWLVELLSVRTLDENRSERNHFSDGGYVGFEIAFRDNAISKMTVSIKIAIFDELVVAVNSTEINDLVIPPNKRIQYVYGKLFLPKSAVPGNATITVAAIDAKKVSYCPQIFRNFWILIENPVFPDFVDAFVYVEATPPTAQPSQKISITVLARNEGTVVLNNIQVQVRANSSLIDSEVLTSLNPYDSRTLNVTWDTSGFPEGNYTVVAEVQTFPKETDLSDNNYSCIVELKTPRPETIHDIEIRNVVCSERDVFQGEKVHVQVVVRNDGNVPESTVAIVYFNDSLVGEEQVQELAPLTERLLAFELDTTGVAQGVYRIAAFAEPVEDEINTANNLYHDGEIMIKLGPSSVIPDMAILTLSVSPKIVEDGNPVTIQATVANLGNSTESCNVIFYYDDSVIVNIAVESLASKAERNVTAIWNTAFIMEGNYTVKAYIPSLVNEEDVSNNLYVDGTVWIKSTRLTDVLLSSAFFAVAAAVVILFLLLILCRRRRRVKKNSQSFNVVISYPHI